MRFPDDVSMALLRAGWSPSRHVGLRVAEWRSRVRSFQGDPLPWKVAEVLGEFGGLRVYAQGPGVDVARTSFEVDPTLAFGMDRLYAEFSAAMGAVLWPAGEASNGYLAIGMDERGRCGVFMERVYLATETFDELVIALVRGVRSGTEWAGG